MTDTSTPAAVPETHIIDGSILAEAIKLVDARMKPEVVELTEPASGIKTHFVIDREEDGTLRIEPISRDMWDEQRINPERRIGIAELLDVPSFIGHVNRFKNDHSMVFADNDRDAPKLVCVLDYHDKGAGGTARFGQHRSRFAFPLSDEWKAWKGADGKKMDMATFASFLEDNVLDIQAPGELTDPDNPRLQSALARFGGLEKVADASTLMSLATNLKVNENAVLGEAVNLATGEGSIQATSEHTTNITVPAIFALGIPVFANGDEYTVFARLRYRKSNGLVFWYELWLANTTFDAAFDHSVERVAHETALPVVLGHPE